jgi:hypothetical protein
MLLFSDLNVKIVNVRATTTENCYLKYLRIAEWRLIWQWLERRRFKQRLIECNGGNQNKNNCAEIDKQQTSSQKCIIFIRSSEKRY